MEILIDGQPTYIKDIFITNIGSHSWNMNRPDSDIDEFIAPNLKVLRVGVDMAFKMLMDQKILLSMK